MQIPELLCPAGNYEKFLAALENGADAIYMGLTKFNARSMTDNFSMNDYKKAINLAHIKGAKIYLTLNTLLYDEDIKASLLLLADLVSFGLDAVIVQDLGLASCIHEVFPNFPLHASTQMTVHNLDGVKMLESLGFTRVVLSRELSLDEIRYIRKNTKLELEVFVHGAACVCYSGSCYLSSLMGGRSANRGKCAQPCRLRYELFDDLNDRIAIGHLMSNKDVYGLPYIKELAEMGIDSLKIEGRNRSSEYVAVSTSKYRKYLDILDTPLATSEINIDDEQELMQVFNRGGKHSHYFVGKKGKDAISYTCAKNWGLPLGKILDVKKNMVKVKLFNDLSLHDGVEILEGHLSGVVTCIRNDKNQLINLNVSADKTVWLGDFKRNDARIGDLLYKTTSSQITKKYNYTYSGKEHIRKNLLCAIVTIKEDFPVTLEVYNDDYNVTLTGTTPAEKAKRNPITAVDIEEKLTRTSSTPFVFSNIVYDIADDLFVPISEINKLRQLVLQKLTDLYEKIEDPALYKQKIKEITDKVHKNAEMNIMNNDNKKPKVDLFLYTYDEHVDYQKFNPSRIYLDYQLIMKTPELIDKLSYLCDIFISLPTIFKGNMEKKIKEMIHKWKDECSGFLIPNIGYLEVFKAYPDVKLIGDFTLNIFNNYSIEEYKKLGLDELTLSMELSENEIKKLDLSNATVIIKGDITVMTSEHCIVGSFAGGFDSATSCRRPCTISNNYHLIDPNGDKIKIECNPIDCSNRLIKHYSSNYYLERIKPARIRYNLDYKSIN